MSTGDHLINMCVLAVGSSFVLGCPLPLPPAPQDGSTGTVPPDFTTGATAAPNTTSVGPGTGSSSLSGTLDGTGTGSGDREVHTEDDVYLVPNCGTDYPWSPSVGLLDNDDLNGSTVATIDAVSRTGASVSISPDGVLVYSPPRPDAYSRDDSFTYTVTTVDGDVSPPATVTLRPTIMRLADAGLSGETTTVVGEPVSRTGISVAAAGDVNADGIDDIIVGAHLASSFAGHAYVVFGDGQRRDQIFLEDPVFVEGFAIRGASGSGFAGLSVAPTGDVNSDGFDDVLVAAPAHADPQGNAIGRLYLVYGKADTDEVLLSAINAGDPAGQALFEGTGHDDWVGFPIRGGRFWNSTTQQYEYVDIGIDGIPDIMIARSRFESNSEAGSVFWLHDYSLGAATVPTPDTITGQAVRIDGMVQSGMGFGLGLSTQLFGDLDADGAPDIAVSSDSELGVSSNSDLAGRVHVALSPASGTTTDTMAVGTTFEGEAGDLLGQAVATADLNNDGFDDLVMSAPGRAFGLSTGGQVYVIYGGADFLPVPELSDLDAESDPVDPPGLVIRGDHLGEAETAVGLALDDAGDFNGDGYRDLVIGSPLSTDFTSPCDSDGLAYVIFGFAPEQAPTAISLEEITCAPTGTNLGVAIHPEPRGGPGSNCTGWSVAGVGDFDADGCDDILLGAPQYNSPEDQKQGVRGRVYIVYGFDPTDPARGCPSAR